MSNSTTFFFLLLTIITILGCDDKDEPLFSKVQGTWFNKNGDFIEILDTTSNNNYVGNNVRSIGKYFQIISDTLSFQDRYSSSEDHFSTERVDKFDFKMASLTDSFLFVIPSSVHAQKIFDKDTIQFTKQDYAVDTDIEFEKITFHTTHCYGHCPTYHLEILKSGDTRLHKEEVYKSADYGIYIIDSVKLGYYTGKLSPEMMSDIVHYIKTCNLENLDFKGRLCCDGSMKTLIIEYNGKRKYFKDMFPPRIILRLIDQLNYICENANLDKSELGFELEK